MARSLSSQKRLRQSKTRAEINRRRKSQIKTAVRHVNDAVHDKDSDKAEKAFRVAAKLLDRFANVGTIHSNKAARKKSQLSKQVQALKTAS